MNDDDIYRLLGAHSEAIDSLKATSRETLDAVHRIENDLSAAKGSVRTAIGIASVGGAIGAGLVKGLAWIKGAG